MKYLIPLFIVFLSSSCFAVYNANHRSEVTGVFVYTDIDDIYVTLKNKPETKCDNRYFILARDIPESRRQMLLSRLLLAFASKEYVNFGYDKEDGACAGGKYVRIHRIG